MDPIANSPELTVGHSDSDQIEIDISNLSAVKFRFKNGAKPGFSPDTFTFMDTNGNWVGTIDSEGWILDTLGRRVKKNRTVSSTVTAMDYYDSDGQVRTVLIERMNINVSTTFPTSIPYPENCSFDQAVTGLWNTVKKITLANGLSYTFGYEKWWDSGNPTQVNPFGEVTKITLPTGGYIKYKWDTIAQRDRWVGCSPNLDARVLVERRVSEDGVNEQVWTYAYTGTWTTTMTTTVTNPLGDTEVHTFSAGEQSVETQVEFRQGSSTALRRVNTDWSSDTGPVAADQPYSYGDSSLKWIKIGQRNKRPIRSTTTLLDVSPSLVTKTETDYGDCYNYTAYSTSYTDCRNATQVREYAYGSGSAGALVRYATFSYLHQSNSTYLNAHFWDRASEKKVYDASGTVKAWSQFSYDTTSITATSGVPYHDYSAYPSTNTVRGNQTLVKRWRNTDGAWLTTTHYFNDVGNLIQTTDPGGHSTTFSYADNYSDGTNRTSQGYVTQITFPSTGGVNHIEKKQYFWYTGLVSAACGQNFSGSCTNTLTPPQPDYSKFTYDALGRPLTVIMADGGQNTFAYNEPTTPSPSTPITVSATTKINATQDLSSTAIIDGLGRVKQTQLTSDPQGTVYTATTYDALSRKLTVSNPYRTTGDPTYGLTTYAYDSLGRVTTVTPPSGGAVTTAYSGNTVTATDAQGKKRKSENDAQGRMVRVWEPDASQSLVHITRYQFDELDNLRCAHQKSTDATADKACTDATVPAAWRPRVYTYNSLSQMLSATNPESGTINFAYDSDGNLTTKTDARSITTTHAYDALHRLTSKTYSNGDPTATFTYDVSSVDGLSIQYPVGRLVKSAQGSTRSVSSFDVGGRVLTNWQCTPLNCGSGWFTLDYTYNLIGGILTQTDGVGNTYTHTYNTAGQVTQLTSSLSDSQHPGTLASSITYNAAGAVAQMTFGNGLVSTVSYNNRMQPTQIVAGSVLTLSYGFSDAQGKNNGNVMSWSASGQQSFSRTYTYDELNRLKTMSASGETCSGLSWTYDAWANRTHQTTTGGTCGQSQMTISTLNRIADTGYSYDAAGNMTAEPGKSYQYDAENRLKSIDNGSTATYVYNAEGQRVRKTVGGTTTEYIYGPGGVVAEKVGSTWTVGYVYLNGALLAEYKSGTTYFAHKDHLGSTRVLTTVSGTVYESYDYMPYGEHSGGAGTTHKFTGKERDSESGLDYFGARYYASLGGRFISADLPFIDQQPANPQSWNLYAYARNNPLRFIDPTGNAAESPEPAASSPMEMGCGITGCAGPTTFIEVDPPEEDPPAGPDSQQPTEQSQGTQPQAKQQQIQTPQQNTQNQGRENQQSQNNQQEASEDAGSGGRRKGERRRTGRPENPTKHVQPHPTKPGRWIVKDPQTGKWLEKPPGWSPQTVNRVTTGAAVVGGAVVVGYVAYRVIRFLPSLAPPLWWTIPANATIP